MRKSDPFVVFHQRENKRGGNVCVCAGYNARGLLLPLLLLLCYYPFSFLTSRGLIGCCCCYYGLLERRKGEPLISLCDARKGGGREREREERRGFRRYSRNAPKQVGFSMTRQLASLLCCLPSGNEIRRNFFLSREPSKKCVCSFFPTTILIMEAVKSRLGLALGHSA